MFHFTELGKLWVFFLKPDLISKLHLLKQNCVVIYHDINNIGNKGYCGQSLRYRTVAKKCWKSSLLKLLFFSIWILFHEHSRFTGHQGKEAAISLTPHEGQTFLGKEFTGRLF